LIHTPERAVAPGLLSILKFGRVGTWATKGGFAMTIRWQRFAFAVAALVVLVVGFAGPARAEVGFGLRGSAWLEDTDPGVGVELVVPLGAKNWYFNPNVEGVFSDANDRLIGNLDFHYDFFQTKDLTVWAGAGLAVIHNQDPRGDQDDNQVRDVDKPVVVEVGGNFLAGIGWKLDQILPYAQLKAVVADDSELVASVGVRF
jgi:hypothetical protein